MAIEPCGFRIKVLPLKLEDVDDVVANAVKNIPGFKMADTDDSKVRDMQIDQGKVIAIGGSAFRAYDDGVAWCKLGDTVAYAKYSGKLIKDPDDNINYLILNDEDIVAIITRSAKENG